MGNVLKYTLIAIGVLILAAWVFLQSHGPKLRGHEKLVGLVDSVKVYYDDYGIPHIYAQNSVDAYRAFGYVHAQDRLFQMEMMRRVGQGRLAEVFGEDFVKTDIFFRTLGTNRKAAAEAAAFDTLPARIQTRINAYIDGINAYADHAPRPLEFVMLGIDPEPYTVEDIYSIAGYMAYSFAAALRTDPLVEQIADKLGPRYLRGMDLANLLPEPPAADSTSADSVATGARPRMEASAALPYRPPLPDEVPVPILQGSNCWSLSPDRTRSGEVLFANDTHIKYSSPAVWYEAHISYPGFDFYGNYLAGIPLPLVGHSRAHAYGLTMFEDDDSDFFVERFAAADSSSTYVSDSLLSPVAKYRETVAYDGTDTTFTVYETHNGVLINDFLPFVKESPVAMYWRYTALETHLLQAFYGMQTANGLEDFRDAVSVIGSPGLNVHYADASGNIAMWSAGKLPIRPKGVGGKRFRPGWVDSLQFRGYHPFGDNPHIVNPDSGLVYSANQMHDSLSGVRYPGYYATYARYDRISDLLNGMRTATADSMMRMALDVTSTQEAAVAREIARVVLNAKSDLSGDARDAAAELQFWDGRHDLTDIQPTIYYKVLYHVLQSTFADELGNEGFEELLGAMHLLTRSYSKFMFRDGFEWWNNVKTGGKTETREQIFIQAFKKSVEELTNELGADMKQWKWERVHVTVHPHPFGSKSLLAPFFNVGPFPSPGGIETINNAGFYFNGEGRYEAYYGPAMRTVIDFADVENAVSILPTGNSGNVLSPHYSDQAEMYIRGEYRKMMMNRKEIEKSDNLLIFSSK